MDETFINKAQEHFGFKLDGFQVDALEKIEQNKSIVVCAPTGAGKTVIAEFAVIKALKENKRVFYTTPLKALSNQKYCDFSETYGSEKVGLLTGDISINRDAQIVVMTTEVYRNMLYGTNLGKIEDNLKNVKTVILDEVHYMNDEQRGTVWEESIIYSPCNIQIIALSATIANSDELTGWINSVHGATELIYTDFRPVPLRHFYYSQSAPDEILPLLSPGGKLNSKIKPEKKQPRYIKKSREFSPAKLVKILHNQDMLPAIYFAFSRKRCDEYMKDCSNLKILNKFEEKRLLQIIDEYIIDNPYLSKHKYLEYLYAGVASHHAGLLPAWKVLVEKLFKQGLIKVVFATETLAAGINMPARTTVISSISKRTDDGHRILTPSEFLQMSGRAGRRGMDDIGYVVVMGNSYQTPEDAAQLATSSADPLESRFSPSYSMVLNLLQRFSVEESRELILKSFGYYTSTNRLKPLYGEMNEIKSKIEEYKAFKCPWNLTNEDLEEYNKLKNQYVQHRKITNTLRKQAKQSGRKQADEVKEYELKTKEFLKKSEKYKCTICKLYNKHIKGIEILERLNSRFSRINRVIEFEKDIYWRNFVNLMNVLTEMKYLDGNYPTKIGFALTGIRAENELFFAEIVLSGLLDSLSFSELAGIVCALSTDETRVQLYTKFSASPNLRKVRADCEHIMKKLYKIQKKYNVDMPFLLNPQFSPLIEYWTQGGEWDYMMKGVNYDEGDIVRSFKRTVDLLRQITQLSISNLTLIDNASTAIQCINRDPISEIY